MSRRPREAREQAVLEAAADRISSAAVRWASALTFGDLADATGIDQAQISRDFGTKDELVVRLIRYMLDPAVYFRHVEHVASWSEGLPGSGLRLDEAFDLWGSSNDELNRGHLAQLRAQMLLWASAEPGSREWRALGDVYRSLVAHHVAEAQAAIEHAIEQGATPRGDLNLQEVVVIMTAVVEGLMIRASVAPDLVDPELTSKAVKALIAGVVGHDDIGPFEQLSKTVM